MTSVTPETGPVQVVGGVLSVRRVGAYHDLTLGTGPHDVLHGVAAAAVGPAHRQPARMSR